MDGLMVTDITATYNELSQRGVEVSEPAMQPWGTIHADFETRRESLDAASARRARSILRILPDLEKLRPDCAPGG